MAQGGEALLETGRQGWDQRAASAGSFQDHRCRGAWFATAADISGVHSLPHECSVSIGR